MISKLNENEGKKKEDERGLNVDREIEAQVSEKV